MKQGWTYKKLGEVLIFDKRFNGIPKEEQPKITKFTHVSAEVLKSLQTDNGEVKLLSTGLFSASTTVDLAGDYINEGEVVTIPTGGAANIKYYKGKFVDSGNILGISNSPHILLKFIYLCMIAKNELINSYFRGASIKHPYMPDIYKIPIPVPPLAEQERIVAELDLLSSVIEKKKTQLNEYDKLAQSIFYSMFGDPDINEMGWEERKLGEITLKITDGVHLKPHYTETGIPFISVVNINKGILDFDGCKYVSDADSKKFNKRIYPEKGDVLYTKVGATYGIPAKVDTDRFFCLYVSVCLIKPLHEQVNTDFLTFIMGLPFVKNQADKRIRGIGVPDLHLNQIASFKIVLPPLSLQQEFAEKIEAIERQKKLIKQSIAETETLFNSRMDYYFN